MSSLELTVASFFTGVSGIPSQSRVVAFRDALYLNLRSFVYWED
jgi:hypothetical protein